MKPVPALGLPLALLLLAGCAGDRVPYNPMGNPAYSAIGENPFWMAAVDGRRIVLTLGPEPGTRPGGLNRHSYPRIGPPATSGAMRWEAGDGAAVIAVEARPGPCTSGGRTFTDRVTVTLSGRMLEGCGGRQIEDERGR